MKRPIQTAPQLVGEQAETIVKLAVLSKGWIYRKLPRDFGVDGEIEIVDASGALTGAIVRVQIKGSQTRLKKVRLKNSTINYFALSPFPTYVLTVNVATGEIHCLLIEDEARENQTPHTHTRTLSLSDSEPLDESWDSIEGYALEVHDASLGMHEYTAYNPAAQLIRCTDLLLNFGGDAAAMLRWMRAYAPDEALTYNYGYSVFLKNQLEANPSLLENLIAWVIEFRPDLEAQIHDGVTRFQRGEAIGRAKEVLKIQWPMPIEVSP